MGLLIKEIKPGRRHIRYGHFYCQKCDRLMPRISSHQVVCHECKEENRKKRSEVMREAYKDANRKIGILI